MSFLQNQLLSIEDDFLEAVADGGSALSVFEERWEKLLADVNRAFDSGCLDDETTAIAHTTAARIATLAETSAELLAHRDQIESDLMVQIDTLMSQLTVSDCDITTQLSSPTPKHAFAHCPTPLDGVLGISTSRKRRRDTLEYPVVGDSIAPLSKRRRHLSCPEKYAEPLDPSLHHPPTSSLYTSPSPTTSRKRRLSDTDISPFPGRPKRSYAGSRLQAASDSYPTLSGQGCAPRLSTTYLPTIDILSEEHSTRSGTGSSISSQSQSPCVATPSDPYDVSQTPNEHDSMNHAPFPELICSDLDGLDGFLKSLLDCTVVPSFPDCFSPPGTAATPRSLGSPSPSQSSVSLTSNSSQSSPSPSIQSLPITPPLCAIIDTPSLPFFDSIDTSLSFDEASLSTSLSAEFSGEPSVVSCHTTACNPLETYLPVSAPHLSTSDFVLASLFDSDSSCLFPPPDHLSADAYWHMQASPVF